MLQWTSAYANEGGTATVYQQLDGEHHFDAGKWCSIDEERSASSSDSGEEMPCSFGGEPRAAPSLLSRGGRFADLKQRS